MKIRFILFALALAVAQIVGIQGRSVDDFNDNVKTDWEDFTFGIGGAEEKNGQFVFQIPAAGQPIFAASTKKSNIYTVQDGRTVEFRVDLISGNSKDSFAILSWIPTSQSVSDLAGYSISKSSTDILVSKGINKYFYNENPALAIKNDNVTLVLALTGQGPNVIVEAKVLDKDNKDAVIFSHRFVDTPAADILREGVDDPATPYTGAGRFVLMEYEDFDAAGPDVYEVVFDNAEAFVQENILLDDFNDNIKSDWKDFSFGVGSAKEQGSQFIFDIPPAGQAIFAASTKTSRTLQIVDGEKIELRVDLISGNSKDSFGVLSWIPTSQTVSDLAGYSIAKSSTDILISKGINKYFYNENPDPAVKNDNVTLVLSLTGRGSDVVINARVLDKDNNDAILFEKTYIDTVAKDQLVDGEDSPAAPYVGAGNFVLLEYEDFDPAGPEVYEVIFDNARISTPLQIINNPPSIEIVSPLEYANFVNPSTSIQFRLADDQDLANEKITFTLNGEKKDASSGLSISGAGKDRTVTFVGLAANKNYVVNVQVIDSNNSTNKANLYFDTFAATNFVIESEDYNFGGGQFYTNPTLVPEGSGPQDNAYAGQGAVVDVDFADARTAGSFPYRPDPILSKRTLDYTRQKFVDAGGEASLIYDYDIGEVRADEYLNYTRNFPTGDYEVYLRQSYFNVQQGQASLEQVTSPANETGQTTRSLGSFLGFNSGSRYRNVPLTDALGNKSVIHLSGEETLRLRQITGDPADGNIYQNYLIFIPATETGLRRATVTSLAPAAGATIESLSPVITAAIENRDTQVDVSSITLDVNGVRVAPTVAATANGAAINYSLTPLPAAGSVVNSRLIFKDNLNVFQTNDWSFTLNYKSLNATNGAEHGSGGARGINVRVVQAIQGANLESSLARAESQLAVNSTIPAYFSTNVIANVINYTQNSTPSAEGYFADDETFPGLVPEENGTDDIALEALTLLQLTQGKHKFGVRSDDGFLVSSGASYRDSNALVLDFRNGGTADQTFEFYVPKTGLYPFRLVYYERGGGANVEWFSIDSETGDKILINDPSNPAAVKAYWAVIFGEFAELYSSSEAAGPYTLESATSVNLASRKIKVDPSGPTRFYQVRYTGAQAANNKIHIASIQFVGGKIEITYELVAEGF